MARLPRYFIKDQPQHIIQRGNNREAIFIANEDYQFYLDWLKEAANKNRIKIHAYVLMTNHVHLLLSPFDNTGIPKTLQSVGRKYVQYFNYQYERTGTLWEGRYRATLIDDEQYLFTCMRYIELNPVRAGMVKHPKNYLWSSYHTNALGKPDQLVTPHPRYTALGLDEHERQKSYRGLFKQRLSKVELLTIREATNKAWVLGSDLFKQEVEKLTQRRSSPMPRGRPKKEDSRV